MSEEILHSFEAGRRGKPDELDAGIAHLVGARLLELDPLCRFDLRVHGGFREGKPHVRLSGEVSQRVLERLEPDNLAGVILSHYNEVHRTGYRSSEIHVEYACKPQSDALASNGHAGDSGNPIAIALRAGPNYLPWERYLAVGLRDLFDTIFRSEGRVPPLLYELTGINHLPGLRADGKISVDARYNERAQLTGIDAVTLALEHEPTLDIERLRADAHGIVTAYLELVQQQHNTNWGEPQITINGAGPWHHGGWGVDEGNREAKPYRDGFATHGVSEDSFSGEDPTKPSGTGTFLARNIAVAVVDNNLADVARVALRYIIGSEDVGLNIFTYGTGKILQEELHSWVRGNFGLRVSDAIERFRLRDPGLYRRIVAASDFFHDTKLPWNQCSARY